MLAAPAWARNTPVVGSNRLSGGALRNASTGVPAGMVRGSTVRSAGTTMLVGTCVNVAVPGDSNWACARKLATNDRRSVGLKIAPKCAATVVLDASRWAFAQSVTGVIPNWQKHVHSS